MIVALAGGVGAAKFLLGLQHVLPAEKITVVGNTGDDLELHGLRICPDLDTVAYTLSGIVNSDQGWGIAADTFHCLRQLRSYRVPAWFKLGDRDLATHLFRTSLLAQGESLTEVTARICAALEVGCRVLPMSDGYHPTCLKTNRGTMHLQEYLVREGCRPGIQEVCYTDIDQAGVPVQVEQAVREAEAVILCPSNPFISIGPILAVPGMRACLQRVSAPVIAITPIVAGEALKGPAARMLEELGHDASATAVARIYRDVVDVFVLDERDATCSREIERLGMKVEVTNTVMANLDDKIHVAGRVTELI